MSSKKYSSSHEISRVFEEETSRLTQALQEGIHAALLRHKQAGQPVCEWRDNQVVWIKPEDIPADRGGVR